MKDEDYKQAIEWRAQVEIGALQRGANRAAWQARKDAPKHTYWERVCALLKPAKK